MPRKITRGRASVTTGITNCKIKDRRTRMKPKPLAGAAVVAIAAALVAPVLLHKTATASASVPMFEFDPNWPKPLPNNWMLGQIGGNFVDSPAIASGSRTVREASTTTTNTPLSIPLKPTAASRPLRSSNSTQPAISSRAGVDPNPAPAPITSGPTLNTASSSITRKTSGSPATATRTPTFSNSPTMENFSCRSAGTGKPGEATIPRT